MSKKCLLLKFPDGREVFSSKKYHEDFMEFAKTFDVKILNVEADLPHLLEPNNIAEIFCDQNKTDFTTCSYHVVDEKKCMFARKKMLEKVIDIRKYIESKFLEGEVVTIKELYNKFKKRKIAVSTIYRHLAHVKDQLAKEGKEVVKMKT